MRSCLIAAALLPLAAAAQEPARPARSGWTVMVDGQGHRGVDVTDASGLGGTYQRSRYGFEAVHEGEDHALDIEYYEYRNHFTGTIAADPDRSYGDTSDLLLTGFNQWQAASGHAHYQLIYGLEAAPESTLTLGEGFRWGLGGAYRWTPGADFDVALGLQVEDRFEKSILPIPYLRATWKPDPAVSVELRVTGLQNGLFARWFLTADKATSLDFACAYETLTFRLKDGTYGARGLGIGEVPVRLGVTQFLEPTGTWFARGAVEWIAFHRETFSHDGETMGVFQANGSLGWSVRLGARF